MVLCENVAATGCVCRLDSTGGGQPRLHFYPGAGQQTNRKIPPGSVLEVLRGGNIKATEAEAGVTAEVLLEKGQVRYQFLHGGKVQVRLLHDAPTKTLEAPETLTKVVQQTSAKKLAQITEFVGGKVPNAIADTKNLVYMNQADQRETDIIRATKGLSQVGLQWVVKHVPAQHALAPWGLALVTLKQIIVPHGGRYTVA